MPKGNRDWHRRKEKRWVIPALILSLLFFLIGVYYWWDKTQVEIPPLASLSPTQEAVPYVPSTPTPPIILPTPPPPEPIQEPILIPEPIPEPEPEPEPTGSGLIWFDEYTYLVGGDNNPIVLVDNHTASNPSWLELETFLETDDTDKQIYNLYDFVCADFAEKLHNNAEASGIRAGYVTLEGIDHALNIFETTDMGLVFVDDTGHGHRIEAVTPPWLDIVTFGETTSWDKIAYVQKGSSLSFISLDVAQLYGFQYSDYKTWAKKKDLFDSKLDKYDEQVGRREIVPMDEYNHLQTQLSKLETLANELGGFWEQEGIVTKIDIFWSGE